MGSPFTFRKYGQSGLEVSELFARTAALHADDLCVIRSMYADVPNHEPSLMLMNCGEGRQTRPSMGSWITYGLGSENQNLPGFIAMCPGGLPIVGIQNWRSAFLPGAYPGHLHRHPAHRRRPPDREHPQRCRDARRPSGVSSTWCAGSTSCIAAERPHDPALEARIQSFELAYRMQSEAADAFDIGREPEPVRTMYGPGTQARQLLITRRLLERGVRFIQVWSGASQPWDDHENLPAHHRQLAGEWDQAIAAFLTDLKQRGLFDQVLVIWGGEFGRTPVAELPALSGRDHNHYGFSMWLAGGGPKGGHVHGATDELGFTAVENKVHVHDLHATILHLLGFDHEKLTYRYAGRDFRLTDVHGHVVKEMVA